MKNILLAIMLIFSTTAIAGSHSGDYKYPKNDCNELFVAISELIEEADNHWIILNNLPEDSVESVKRAENIYWLTSVAANYTTVFESFCDN
tara:strand:+ start:121 stop:393 length:273 start_codon:yes stop_codon:yes gene_type:complete